MYSVRNGCWNSQYKGETSETQLSFGEDIKHYRTKPLQGLESEALLSWDWLRQPEKLTETMAEPDVNKIIWRDGILLHIHSR